MLQANIEAASSYLKSLETLLWFEPNYWSLNVIPPSLPSNSTTNLIRPPHSQPAPAAPTSYSPTNNKIRTIANRLVQRYVGFPDRDVISLKTPFPVVYRNSPSIYCDENLNILYPYLYPQEKPSPYPSCEKPLKDEVVNTYGLTSTKSTAYFSQLFGTAVQFTPPVHSPYDFVTLTPTFPWRKKHDLDGLTLAEYISLYKYDSTNANNNDANYYVPNIIDYNLNGGDLEIIWDGTLTKQTVYPYVNYIMEQAGSQSYQLTDAYDLPTTVEQDTELTANTLMNTLKKTSFVIDAQAPFNYFTDNTKYTFNILGDKGTKKTGADLTQAMGNTIMLMRDYYGTPCFAGLHTATVKTNSDAVGDSFVYYYIDFIGASANNSKAFKNASPFHTSPGDSIVGWNDSYAGFYNRQLLKVDDPDDSHSGTFDMCDSKTPNYNYWIRLWKWGNEQTNIGSLAYILNDKDVNMYIYINLEFWGVTAKTIKQYASPAPMVKFRLNNPTFFNNSNFFKIGFRGNYQRIYIGVDLPPAYGLYLNADFVLGQVDCDFTSNTPLAFSRLFDNPSLPITKGGGLSVEPSYVGDPPKGNLYEWKVGKVQSL